MSLHLLTIEVPAPAFRGQDDGSETGSSAPLKVHRESSMSNGISGFGFVIAICGSAVGFLGSVAIQAGQVIDLGVPAGAIETGARAVSDDGNAVAGLVLVTPGTWNTAEYYAASWTAEGGWQNLSVDIPYHLRSWATGISAAGDVLALGVWVPYPYPNGSAYTAFPYAWTVDSGLVELERFSNVDTYAVNASVDGAHILGYTQHGNNDDRWTIWNVSDGSVCAEGRVDENASNVAVDASADEAVVAIHSYDALFGNWRAWVTVNGAAQQLAEDACPTAVSRNGLLVAGQVGTRAVLWQYSDGTWEMVYLDPNQTFGTTLSLGVLNDGTVIGSDGGYYVGHFWSEPSVAWIYLPNEGMINLVQYLNELGISTCAWRSFHITDISPDGRFLAGTGWRAADGIRRAVLIDSIPSIMGDCDNSGTLDIVDFTDYWPGCLLGPAIALPCGCECTDLDENGNCDLRDFATFQAHFTGPLP